MLHRNSANIGCTPRRRLGDRSELSSSGCRIPGRRVSIPWSRSTMNNRQSVWRRQLSARVSLSTSKKTERRVTLKRGENMSRVPWPMNRALEAAAIVLACASFSQAKPNDQTFALSDTRDLVLLNVKAEAVEYKGRKAVRLTKDVEKDGFALLRGSDFQDGTIEADIALKITTPPGVRMPGFVGIAFRARPDASRYELFYLRPGNSHAEDQAMRNHVVQYTSEPDFGWYKLRREWPWVYESHAELQTETWTKVKIDVKGRVAKIYLNESEQADLIVDGLKGEHLRGGIALWGYQGEEAYFSDLRISNSTPLPVKNGADAAGTWQVKCASDAGPFEGTLQLTRDADKVVGTWSGELGKNRSITGTWRNGYVELRFSAEWPTDSKGAATPAVATLAGWIDGESAGGRMKVDGSTEAVAIEAIPHGHPTPFLGSRGRQELAHRRQNLLDLSFQREMASIQINEQSLSGCLAQRLPRRRAGNRGSDGLLPRTFH